jgi:glucosamine-phosphate N-acetyltransferase
MEKAITYRLCTRADFSELLALLRQLWPEMALVESELKMVFDQGLEAANQSYLGAEHEGRLVGFCSLNVLNNLWLHGNMGHIDELIVDERYRDLGIGTRLLQEIAEIATKMGCKRVELDSAHHRLAAHRFYEHHGFSNRALVFSKPLGG